MRPQVYDNQSGYITLMTILIIGAISIAVSGYLLISGVDITRTSLTLEQSHQAKSLVNACAEVGLQKARSTSQTGTTNLTIAPGTCSYTITTNSGSLKTVQATGMVSNATRKITIQINTSQQGTDAIVVWQEVADL